MTQNESDSIWNNMELNGLISETNIKNKALDLKKRSNKWIDDNAQYFDLFDWDESNEKLYRNKAFNEAGVYLLNTLQNGNQDAIPSLEQLIIDRVNDQRFVQLMLRNPKRFHHFVYPALYSKYTKNLEPYVENALEEVSNQGQFWSVERQPYRYLELCYLSRIFDVENEHDEETIVKFTLLNHQPNIVGSSCSEAYSLTHDVMLINYDKLYYSEISNNKYISSVAKRYNINKVLRGLILRFMAKDNADITLELLLAGVLQRQISRELVRLVLTWILEKTKTDGYVPGPSKGSMSAPKLSENANIEEEPVWKYKYKNQEDAIWAKNYHTNIVAGMAFRIIKRDWDKLANRQMNHSLEDYSFRQETLRLGELLSSLGDYDLKKGSQQMLELANSPVTSEFPLVFQEAVEFLEDQRTREGEYGYWTSEEIIYMNEGNSKESFRNELVEPVSKNCREALNAIKENKKS